MFVIEAESDIIERRDQDCQSGVPKYILDENPSSMINYLFGSQI